MWEINHYEAFCCCCLPFAFQITTIQYFLGFHKGFFFFFFGLVTVGFYRQSETFIYVCVYSNAWMDE